MRNVEVLVAEVETESSIPRHELPRLAEHVLDGGTVKIQCPRGHWANVRLEQQGIPTSDGGTEFPIVVRKESHTDWHCFRGGSRAQHLRELSAIICSTSHWVGERHGKQEEDREHARLVAEQRKKLDDQRIAQGIIDGYFPNPRQRPVSARTERLQGST